MSLILPGETEALLAALIHFNTVNPPGNELLACAPLADWLLAHGVSSEIQLLDDNRANLVARVRGRGAKRALAFCGHLDTVPVGNADWTFAPFSARAQDGRMYGRGAADMKGGIAAMAAAVASISNRESPLPCDILLFATAGEEVNSIGAQTLLERGTLDEVGALVIGEPTDMQIAIAHKGALWVQVQIAGRAAHGSMPHLGSNAILNTMSFLRTLADHPFRVESHPLLGAPTLSPDMIRAGVGVNVVPELCEVALDIRTLPGMSHENVLHDLHLHLNEGLDAAEAKSSRLSVLLDRPAIETPIEAELVQLALQVQKQVTGQTLTPIGMSYYTDASVLVPTGKLPTIIWGPGQSSQAHQVDEWVSLDRVHLAATLYERLALEYSVHGHS